MGMNGCGRFVSVELIPVHEEQVHREVMGKKDVHYEERREMEDYSYPENPPPKRPPEEGEREEQLPQENEANREWQISLHFR